MQAGDGCIKWMVSMLYSYNTYAVRTDKEHNGCNHRGETPEL